MEKDKITPPLSLDGMSSLKLENGDLKHCRRSEQAARSFTECHRDCPWLGCCLNGTKFDDGKGGLKPGSFVPWLDFSQYSPCFIKYSKYLDKREDNEY
jgi:hypothetical protein